MVVRHAERVAKLRFSDIFEQIPGKAICLSSLVGYFALAESHKSVTLSCARAPTGRYAKGSRPRAIAHRTVHAKFYIFAPED
jgi:hypothetical protein